MEASKIRNVNDIIDVVNAAFKDIMSIRKIEPDIVTDSNETFSTWHIDIDIKRDVEEK